MPGVALLPLGVQPDTLDDPVLQTRVTDADIRWVRLWVNWGNPSGYDGRFRQAADLGLEILAVVGGGPGWAHEDVVNNYNFGPIDEEDLDAFAASIQALVERYDGDGDYNGDGVEDGPPMPRVTYWEFGNEPDNKSISSSCVYVGGLWGAQMGVDGDSMPDPEEYARMLSYAYPAVKAGNPAAQVVFGALAYEYIDAGCFEDPQGPRAFLDQVLDWLAAHPEVDCADVMCFDVMAFHQYDFKRDVWDGALPYNQGVLGKTKAIRDKLAAYGLTKPIIVSEIGLNSAGLSNGEELQARHLVHEFVRGMSLWPDEMVTMIWFELVDNAYGDQFGLLAHDPPTYSPDPSYYTYQTLTAELGGIQSFERQLGAALTGSRKIQAYRFVMQDGRKKLVLWTDDGDKLRKNPPDPQINTAIGAAQLNDTWTGTLRLRVVDSTSYPTPTETIIEDGGPDDLDGVVNDQVTLKITQDPIYVELAP